MGRYELIRAFGVVVLSSACASRAWADGVSPEKATQAERATAQKAYVKGADAFKEGRFADALAEFRASYATVASPNSHLMLARSLRESGDLLAAYAEMQRVLPEADAAAAREAKYQSSADAAKKELGELRAKIALVTIVLDHASDGATVTAAGKPIDRASLGKPMAFLPGALVVDATAGDVSKHESIALAAGDDKTIHLDLAPPAPPASTEPVAAAGPAAPEPAPPAAAPPPVAADTSGQTASTMRTLAYVSGGVGVAGLATFAIFGAMNQSKYHGLEDACDNGHCPANRQDDIDAGRRDQMIANVGLGIGLLGVATGTALWLGSSGASASSPQVSAGRPVVVVAPGSVHVEGRF
jgi:hypothetical protein